MYASIWFLRLFSSPRSVLSVLSNIGQVYCPIHSSLAAEVLDASKRLMMIFIAGRYFRAQYLVSRSICLSVRPFVVIADSVEMAALNMPSVFLTIVFLQPNVV